MRKSPRFKENFPLKRTAIAPAVIRSPLMAFCFVSFSLKSKLKEWVFLFYILITHENKSLISFSCYLSTVFNQLSF